MLGKFMGRPLEKPPGKSLGKRGIRVSAIARRWMIALLGASLALAVAGPVLAGSLADAKAAGHIGEKLDGTVGPVGSPPSEVKALIAEVNAKRRARYAEIAKKSGADLAAVGQRAGRKAIGKTAPGNYIESPGGGWAKK